MSDWMDDAYDYSTLGTDHVKVQITSYSGPDGSNRQIIHNTDFVLTPEQAKAMFLALDKMEEA